MFYNWTFLFCNKLLFIFWIFYATSNILYEAIERLIRQRQQQSIVESSKTPKVHYNIFTHGRNRCVKIVSDKNNFLILDNWSWQINQKFKCVVYWRGTHNVCTSYVSTHPSNWPKLKKLDSFYVIIFHNGLLWTLSYGFW